LKVLCHTGGVCSPDLKKEWFRILSPEKIYEIYSMTECVGITSIRGDEWLIHEGSVGKMPCGSIAIRDDNGQDLPVGQAGNIYMSWTENAPEIGFLNSPPPEISKDGFRSVGDIGYIDNDGYLYFVDRRSDMIVTGGENVFANEVETVLKKSKKVLDVVVVGIPDKEWGHRIHAIVETKEPVSDKSLIRLALDYLPPYKIPKSFEFVDEIPRNANGKVVRSTLVEQYIKNNSDSNGD
ncbi:MAG TPA: AMP-binding protein, partial [Candidatus Choladousia intestinavium]|nr:AMP-binding protein [Candidatus Choladousia intestinavium]